MVLRGGQRAHIVGCDFEGCDYRVTYDPETKQDYILSDLLDRGCYVLVDDHGILEKILCPLHVPTVGYPSSRENLPPYEVRTTSSTGGQKGVKPERMSLIPVEALEIMGRLYGFGEQKYAAHNWRKGYEWSKSYDSLQRHAGAFWRGEDYDEETGLPHLAGVVFHAFTLMIFMQEQPEFDDRFKPEQSKMIQENLAEISKAIIDYRAE